VTRLATNPEALVLRARAGDQNAMSLLREIGEAARNGLSSKAKLYYKRAMAYVRANRPTRARGGMFGFGGEVVPSLAAYSPAPHAIVDERQAGVQARGQHAAPAARKPLPKGALDRIFDLESLPVVVLRACRFRDGLGAAAVVLASGPPITKAMVQEIGLSHFGSDDASAAFFYGVRHYAERDVHEAAEMLPDNHVRKPFIVGQCVGRAWRLQAVRRPGSRIGVYAPVAGWELGDPPVQGGAS
jgi:hypothetical protein